MTDNRVLIFDTTLRDGEQAPGYSMNIEEKQRIARQLDALGVDIIEAGFPAASVGDFEAVSAIAAHHRRPTIAALARACREDIELTGKALAKAAHPRLHTFIATSDIHLQFKLRCTRAEVLDRACQAVELAHGLVAEVEFSPEDATRTDLDFLVQIVQEVIAAGATVINIPDTVGYTIPSEMYHLIKTLFMRVNNIDQAVISVHCHNDLGLAVANSLAALDAGARQIESTINGIGERAGNASLEELVMALRVRQDALPYFTAINTEYLYPTSQMLTEITGIAVQPNKAIVGRNAFAHEAGIHQDGMLKNSLTYQIMTPESVGVPESKLVLGKHSGRHALKYHLERLGYHFNRFETDRLYRNFTRFADTAKQITEQDLIALAEEAKQASLLSV
ncbi:MAG: 2-isopropylmalate synthase [Acidobacteriota bacterium]